MSEDTKQLKVENEVLREELHRLSLKYDSLVKSHSTEVEYLKEEHEIEKADLKARVGKVHDEYKAREAIKDDRNLALTEEVNQLREEVDGLKTQCDKLKGQVEVLKTAKTTGAASSYSDYEGLKESQRILKGQLAEKDEILSANCDKISRLDREVVMLRGMVQELNEIGEGKDSAIKELGTRIKDLEREKDEETGTLQNEVLALKEEIKQLSGKLGGTTEDTQRAGGASRGNSLFSEVDERRLKVEEELKRLRELVKRLTAENRNLQLELERGDTHSASITTQLEVIAKSEHELVQEVKKDRSEMLQLFDSYRDRLESLRDKYTQRLNALRTQHPDNPSETEQLIRERDGLLLIKLSLERDKNELTRELKYNKHLRTHAEANLKILKAELDFLKNGGSSEKTAPLDNALPLDTDQNLNPVVEAAKSSEKNENVMSPNRVTIRKPIIRNETHEQCNQQ